MSDHKTRSIDRLLAAFVPQFITPNMLTAFRLVSVPIVVILFLMHRREMGVGLFFFAMLTDAFDGALARSRNQFSEWGMKYDPLADKLMILVGAVFILFAYAPRWATYVIMGMEIAVALGYLLFVTGMKFKIGPNAFGKVKMVSLSTGVVSLGLYGLTGTPTFYSIGVIAIHASIFLGALSIAGYALRLATD